MAVTVKFFANFREAVGKEQESVEAVTDVAALIDELVSRFGKKLAEQLYESDTKRLRETVHILINGRAINLLEGLNTPLKDGDVIAIFPPVSGGGPLVGRMLFFNSEDMTFDIIEARRDPKCPVCKGV